ncbi:hypothetical protein DOTSEDRAFT_70199 [Dothistroma septosporum NZE10]|uniref:Uncharacterized protein n=1 Tax=Dothistroma septosporum (strain NZE10 / CBS 128990) TaxID=675120 RepID=N1PUP9_DOTSN|nr:hypothetical protein DOTSEDRAFT_70199 [Dothistroma septosporum NZE10]
MAWHRRRWTSQAVHASNRSGPAWRTRMVREAVNGNSNLRETDINWHRLRILLSHCLKLIECRAPFALRRFSPSGVVEVLVSFI